MQVSKSTFIWIAFIKYLLSCTLLDVILYVVGPFPQVLPVWGLAIPLPAVLMITLSLYMVVLGIGLWIRSCLKVGATGPVTVKAGRLFSSLQLVQCKARQVYIYIYSNIQTHGNLKCFTGKCMKNKT